MESADALGIGFPWSSADSDPPLHARIPTFALKSKSKFSNAREKGARVSRMFSKASAL
jgi:hypothetical protein